MKALIQRVKTAAVVVDGETIGQIDQGILLFLGVEKHDDAALAERMLNKILKYRIFEDENGRMGRSLQDIEGGLLVVSQFTLAADTKKGTKPSFSSAASPQHGIEIYESFLTQARQCHPHVASGRFGADMKVSLINDGPVTFLFEL